MGWKEKSKYTLWAVGVSCGIVAEAEAANSLFKNQKTLFERLDLTKNLNKTHHTGIPIWQAVFRTTLLDRSLYAQGRLDVGVLFRPRLGLPLHAAKHRHQRQSRMLPGNVEFFPGLGDYQRARSTSVALWSMPRETWVVLDAKHKEG
jgi:hypothetical protein